MNQNVHYGEIYLFDFGLNEGSIQNGIRPAVVIQDDTLNRRSPTTIIAAVTSVPKKIYLPSHIVIGKDGGVEKPSMVLLEQCKTVNKSDLGQYIGLIDSAYLRKKIRNGLKKTFGMWDYNRLQKGDIRCLCSQCLQDYLDLDIYSIRRLDPFQESKDICTKCNRKGYDYIFTERKGGVRHET